MGMDRHGDTDVLGDLDIKWIYQFGLMDQYAPTAWDHPVSQTTEHSYH